MRVLPLYSHVIFAKKIVNSSCVNILEIIMVIELKRVFISDEVDPRCVEVLKENGIEVVKDTKLRTDKEKFLAEISVFFFFIPISSLINLSVKTLMEHCYSYLRIYF